MTIEVLANNNVTGMSNGELTIDTSSSGGSAGPDDNDLVVPLSSTAYADQARLNANPQMDTGLAGWQGNAVSVTPGIAPGSPRMARVPGEGDANGAGAHPSALFQAAGIPDGFPDFEFTAYFTPASTANFADYVDPAGSLGVTGPRGAYTDRTFQWVLLGSDADPPDPAYGDIQSGNTIINIAYMPDGVQEATGPASADFYVFDGSTFLWERLGITTAAGNALDGSVDSDTDGNPLNGVGDGVLDGADTINVYKLTGTGTGFGTPAASYDGSATDIEVTSLDTGISGFSVVQTEEKVTWLNP